MIRKFHEYFGVWGWRAVAFDLYLVYVVVIFLAGTLFSNTIAKWVDSWLLH